MADKDWLTAHFDHHDREFMKDPYPGYAVMREQCPVTWSDRHGGFWVLTRYDDVYKAFRDAETFANGIATIPNSGHGDRRFPLIQHDPPEHQKYRAIVQPWFTAQRVTSLEPNMRRRAIELIDEFIERGRCDLFRDFARRLPADLIADMMGVPRQDKDKFEDWARRITEDRDIDPEGAVRAYTEMTEYYGDLLARRRKDPRDDIPSVLVQAKIDGRPLDDEELILYCVLIENAGFDTTSTFIGTALWWLGEHPEHRQKLIDDPSLIVSGTDELLRILAPASPARLLRRDTEVRGCPMKKGDQGLLVIPSANRDPEHFPDPEEVIFDRSPNRHLAFGVGIHRCLGMYLAESESRIALEEVLRRIPDYRIDGEVTWANGQKFGVRSLPVRFSPGEREGERT